MSKHSEREHAIISPSNTKRIVKCPGSAVITEVLGIKSEPNEFTEEGTKAHELAEKLLSAKLDGRKIPAIGDADREMYNYCTGYMLFVNALWQKFKAAHTDAKYLIEECLAFSDLTWGTLDFAAFGRNKKTGKLRALIIDFKYGRGLEVDAEGNEQLSTYALCLEKSICGDEKLEKAYLYVYQPRIGEIPWSKGVLSQEDIEQWQSEILDTEYNIEDMLGAEDPVQAAEAYLDARGLDHCRFCLLKLTCQEFKDEVNKGAIAVLQGNVEVDFARASTKSLVELYKKKKAVEQLLKEGERELLMRLSKGEQNDEFKLVESRRQRKWVDDEKAVHAKLKELGCKRTYRRSLVTIGEVEEQIGKKKALLSDITELSTPKLQLAPVSDKREAVAISAPSDLLTVLKV